MTKWLLNYLFFFLNWFIHAYILCYFSHIWLFATAWTLWTVAHQIPVHGIFLARILEWVAMSSSRGSSLPRDQIQVFYVSCIGRQLLYHYCHLGILYIYIRIQFAVINWSHTNPKTHDISLDLKCTCKNFPIIGNI